MEEKLIDRVASANNLMAYAEKTKQKTNPKKLAALLTDYKSTVGNSNEQHGDFLPKELKEKKSQIPALFLPDEVEKKTNKNPLVTSISPGRVVPVRQNDTAADLVAKIYNLLKKSHDERKLEDDLKKDFEEERQMEAERRHKQFVKALTGITLKGSIMDKTTKEKGGLGWLKDLFDKWLDYKLAKKFLDFFRRTPPVPGSPGKGVPGAPDKKGPGKPPGAPGEPSKPGKEPQKGPPQRVPGAPPAPTKIDPKTEEQIKKNKIKPGELLDKNGKPLRGAALDSRVKKIAAEKAAKKAAGYAAGRAAIGRAGSVVLSAVTGPVGTALMTAAFLYDMVDMLAPADLDALNESYEILKTIQDDIESLVADKNSGKISDEGFEKAMKAQQNKVTVTKQRVDGLKKIVIKNYLKKGGDKNKVGDLEKEISQEMPSATPTGTTPESPTAATTVSSATPEMEPPAPTATAMNLSTPMPAAPSKTSEMAQSVIKENNDIKLDEQVASAAPIVMNTTNNSKNLTGSSSPTPVQVSIRPDEDVLNYVVTRTVRSV